MNKRTLVLALVFMIGAVVQVGAHHAVLNIPDKWCGAGPPYSGTLWIWAEYGLPWAWLNVGTWEKYTTAPRPLDIDYTRIYWDGLILNLATFGVINHLIRPRKREDEIND